MGREDKNVHGMVNVLDVVTMAEKENAALRRTPYRLVTHRVRLGRISWADYDQPILASPTLIGLNELGYALLRYEARHAANDNGVIVNAKL
jgi:hypothetical protein